VAIGKEALDSVILRKPKEEYRRKNKGYMSRKKQSGSWKTKEDNTKRRSVVKARLLCQAQWTVE